MQIMKRFSSERKKYCTQEKLAEIVGVNTKTISAFENGRRTPSLVTFVKMCNAINVDLNYLVKGDMYEQ